MPAPMSSLRGPPSDGLRGLHLEIQERCGSQAEAWRKEIQQQASGQRGPEGFGAWNASSEAGRGSIAATRNEGCNGGLPAGTSGKQSSS